MLLYFLKLKTKSDFGEPMEIELWVFRTICSCFIKTVTQEPWVDKVRELTQGLEKYSQGTEVIAKEARAGKVAQWLKRSSCTHGGLSSDPQNYVTYWLGMVACLQSQPWKTEEGFPGAHRPMRLEPSEARCTMRLAVLWALGAAGRACLKQQGARAMGGDSHIPHSTPHACAHR